MYFNSKDRAKLTAARQKLRDERNEQLAEEEKDVLGINPTGSYSARNVNPEYVSRLKTNPSSQQEDIVYFPSGYQPISVNPALRSSYYAPGSFMSPFYGSAFANPYYSSFGNPYGSFYSPWSDPYYYNPYNSFNSGWNSSWSLSFSYGFGGWYPQMGYGWNYWSMPSSLFWDSYYGYNAYSAWGWGSGWNSWGSPFCYNGYNYYRGYAPVVIVDNSGGRQVVYSKRSDRSSSLNNVVDSSRPINSVTRTGREISSGRVRSESNNTQPTYYERSWRQNPEVTQTQTRSYWGNESNVSRSYSGGNNNTTTRQRSTWSSSPPDNNSFLNSNSSSQRSSSSSFSSGGTRSQPSGGSSSSSSGGTRSRGRD